MIEDKYVLLFYFFKTYYYSTHNTRIRSKKKELIEVKKEAQFAVMDAIAAPMSDSVSISVMQKKKLGFVLILIVWVVGESIATQGDANFIDYGTRWCSRWWRWRC